MILGNKAQGLIGAIIASGVSLMALTAAIDFVKFGFKGSSFITSRAEFNSALGLVQLVLSKGEYCLDSLKPLNPTLSFAGGDYIELKAVEMEKNSLLYVGQRFNDHVVNSLKIKKLGKSPDFLGKLEVTLDKAAGSLGGSLTESAQFDMVLEGSEETLKNCSGGKKRQNGSKSLVNEPNFDSGWLDIRNNEKGELIHNLEANTFSKVQIQLTIDPTINTIVIYDDMAACESWVYGGGHSGLFLTTPPTTDTNYKNILYFKSGQYFVCHTAAFVNWPGSDFESRGFRNGKFKVRIWL